MPLRAITLDYWDTLYLGASVPERVRRRREGVGRMLEAIGVPLPAEQFEQLYRASAAEAERWWREEHRGYTSGDRIRWILAELGVERPTECEHLAAACQLVDDTLVEIPPPLLPGAREALAALGERYRLAIVSDTGFASGRAQDRLLERDGLLGAFDATLYSVDVGVAKPKPAIFHAALDALDVAPGEALHVGDNEFTDVAGALAVGMRAVRLDVVQERGETRAERVARSLTELADYLLTTPGA